MPQPKIADAATPAELGYAMPAEWEPHAATWLGWPHNRSRLAGQDRRHPLGLWRNGAQNFAGRTRADSRPAPGRAKTCRQLFETRGLRFETGRICRASDQSRLDARQRADIRQKRRSEHPKANIQNPIPPSSIFISMRGRNMMTGRRTRKVPETAARNCCKKPLFNAQFNGKAFHHRRRRHRGERPRHAAHHRGMLSASENPGAQSRHDAGAIRRDVQEISRRQQTCSGCSKARPATTRTGTLTTSAAL